MEIDRFPTGAALASSRALSAHSTLVSRLATALDRLYTDRRFWVLTLVGGDCAFGWGFDPSKDGFCVTVSFFGATSMGGYLDTARATQLVDIVR